MGAWQGACADHNHPRSWPASGQRRTRSRQPLRKGDLRTDHGRSASRDGQDACSAADPRLLAATPPAALAQSWPTPVRDRGVASGRWATSWTQRRTRAWMGRKGHCVWSTRKRVSGANTLAGGRIAPVGNPQPLNALLHRLVRVLHQGPSLVTADGPGAVSSTTHTRGERGCDAPGGGYLPHLWRADCPSVHGRVGCPFGRAGSSVHRVKSKSGRGY